MQAIDPTSYREMDEGRIYALAELLHFGDPEHEAYIQHFLAPSGMKFLRMLRVVEPSGVSAWL